MNMSNSEIPKEEQTAYQRWEMSTFSETDVVGSFSPKKLSTKSAAATGISSALEGVRKEAYTKGMQEGFAVGLAKAKEYAATEQTQFLTIMSTFEQALEKADQTLEEEVLGLALEVAKLMLKTKINVDPEVILPVVRDAIHYLPHVKKPAIILVHPEDARILRAQLGEELSEQDWQVQEDDNVERGGCLVETGENKIDATNATRWKRISDALAQTNDWLLP